MTLIYGLIPPMAGRNRVKKRDRLHSYHPAKIPKNSKINISTLLRLIGIDNSPQDLYTMTLDTIYTRYNVHNVSKDFFLLLAKGLLYILSESIGINKEAKKSSYFHLDFSIQAHGSYK